MKGHIEITLAGAWRLEFLGTMYDALLHLLNWLTYDLLIE